MPIFRQEIPVGEVTNVNHISRFTNNLDQEAASKLMQPVFAAYANEVDLEYLMSTYGSVDTEWTDNTRDFSYEIVSEKIDATKILWASGDGAFVGANGAEFEFISEFDLFVKKKDAGGAPDHSRFKVLEELGRVTNGYRYRAVALVERGIPRRYMNGGNESLWQPLFSRTSAEFSIDGSGVKFQGAVTRTGKYMGIRKSDIIGSETANRKVSVYTMSHSKDATKTEKVMFQYKEEALMNAYYEEKRKLIMWGKESEVQDFDPDTGEPLLNADGLYYQRGESNIHFVNTIDIDEILQALNYKASTRRIQNPHYMLEAASEAYRIIIGQIETRYSAALQQTLKGGDTNVALGYIPGSITLNGIKLTIVKDLMLGDAPHLINKTSQGFRLGDYTVMAYPIGDTRIKNKRSKGVLMKKVTTKYDKFHFIPGIDKVTSGDKFAKTISMLDGHKISAIGQLAVALVDPEGAVEFQLNER